MTNLLNRLNGLTRFQSKHDYIQSKPIKIMSVSNYVGESRQILPALLSLLPPILLSVISLYLYELPPFFSIVSFSLLVLFFLLSLLSIVSLLFFPILSNSSSQIISSLPHCSLSLSLCILLHLRLGLLQPLDKVFFFFL